VRDGVREGKPVGDWEKKGDNQTFEKIKEIRIKGEKRIAYGNGGGGNDEIYVSEHAVELDELRLIAYIGAEQTEGKSF